MMHSLLPASRPLLILAPMQDITDGPFWRVMLRYGGPDGNRHARRASICATISRFSMK
jgi:tRNA-dihydrouridine synthase